MSSTRPTLPRRYRMRAAPPVESSTGHRDRSAFESDSTSERFPLARWLLAAALVGGAAVLGANARAAEVGHIPEQNRQAQRAPSGTGENEPSSTSWWTPGSGKPLAELTPYRNASGSVGVLNANGPVVTAGHPFFEPIGQ